MSYIYREDVLEQLARHGVRPGPATRPGLVMDFLNDLYRYEIRRLKRRLLRKEFPQADYVGLIIGLRRQYPLISIPVLAWMAPGSDRPDDQPLC